MDNPTRLTLERPPAGAVDLTLQLTDLLVAAGSFGAPPEHASKLVTHVVMLMSTGRIELAGPDAIVAVALVKWLSSKLPRKKFSLRMDSDDGSRVAYDFFKGGVVERDPAKPKPKPASKELELTLRNAADPRPYAAGTRFAIGDVLEHPSFGRGLVTKLVDQKMVVQFVDAERTLVHARA